MFQEGQEAAEQRQPLSLLSSQEFSFIPTLVGSSVLSDHCGATDLPKLGVLAVLYSVLRAQLSLTPLPAPQPSSLQAPKVSPDPQRPGGFHFQSSLEQFAQKSSVLQGNTEAVLGWEAATMAVPPLQEHSYCISLTRLRSESSILWRRNWNCSDWKNAGTLQRCRSVQWHSPAAAFSAGWADKLGLFLH